VAVQEKAENIPPLLGGEVMRAILTGDRYPRTLLAAVIQRLRAGEPVNGARAALCRAVIQRDLRKRPAQDGCADTRTAGTRTADTRTADTRKKEEVPVALDRAQTNAAYRMGRLFAVLENVQRSALGRVNASIRDRYFGAASATPASVFPLLLRGSTHHLSVLRKNSGTGGLAVWFEREIGEIMDGLPMDLPRHLTLENQGRFAVGYYHQRNARKPAADAGTPATDRPADAPDEE
jgi:CRISPR-associated protein Csd1